jgi:hypothetical protein
VHCELSRDHYANRLAAVAYGFLERLLHIGDSGRFLQEEARLRSLANVLNAAGFVPYLYEDFADELFDLMRRLATALDEGNGEEALLDAFNDENLQNCVITHMRVGLQSTYYFVTSGTNSSADSYCRLDEDPPRELPWLYAWSNSEPVL